MNALQLVARLRALHRGVKVAFLLVAVWALDLGAAHPLGALALALPASALFVLSTRGSNPKGQSAEDVPHESP